MESRVIHLEDLKKDKIFDGDYKKGSLDIMTSSTTSINSSLASPGDSGVQMLDSESELMSVMSASGIGYEMESLLVDDGDRNCDKSSTGDVLNVDIKNVGVKDKISFSHENTKDCTRKDMQNKVNDATMIVEIFECCVNVKEPEKSDPVVNESVENQNVEESPNVKILASTPLKSRADESNKLITQENFTKQTSLEFKEDELLESDGTRKNEKQEDLMNISLNSYELLDYTIPNKSNSMLEKSDEMHVSLSEEVNETLKVTVSNTIVETSELPAVKDIFVPTDEQIVFRRQRKKKSKSDTPKKRVSFHEDILNSTKIDDVHINHGFVTIEPDVSTNFFRRGFKKKPDVIKGRYSWAAEGDAPFYESNMMEREVKSDIYVNTSRFSSTSSSSSISVSSSIDEEDSSTESNELHKVPSQKMPKSSCLKKTKSKKYIDTNIVEETVNVKHKKSDGNLLETKIFGSLKNILNFSSSVPLAERGVPEGQEDVALYSTSHESVCGAKLKSEKLEEGVPVAPVQKLSNLNIELAKTNLKLTKSEGFYPNYPNNQNLPSNIILCDSNVYEHKGISYSYEYDNFQKTFEKQQTKSSNIYQKMLSEFNLFRKKAREEHSNGDKVDTIDTLPSQPKNEMNENVPKVQSNLNKYASATTLDWSDNDTTISDHNESARTKHLNSPKHKIRQSNHYALSSFRSDGGDIKYEDIDSAEAKSSITLRTSSSKNSLINRFLRNVTIKKMIDIKQKKKLNTGRRYVDLYIKGVRVDSNVNDALDKQIEDEVMYGLKKKSRSEHTVCYTLAFRLKREIFRDPDEDLTRVFPVRSAYTTNGESRTLLFVLTNSTLYISGCKPNNSLYNYFVLPYTEINTVLVGPNAQTIHISNYDKDMQCMITTGCGNITGEMISQLEMAMRRDENKPQLPAVKQLTLRDMDNLRRSVCKQTSVEVDEEYFYYSVMNFQDYVSQTGDTPLGPNKEGPLMFKISESDSRWETAYFILKAGVLYMLSSPSHKVPMRVFPLINGACQGARRIYNYPRPHTFQLSISNTTLHLAAPDEFVASDWLQALVQAASGTYNNKEKQLAQSCSLLMTSDHILTMREAFPCNVSSTLTKTLHDPIKGARALSCALISDITAFRLPSAEHSWCILEFSCREVHESSGDWILYFSSNAELENFISTLEKLWAYHNDHGDSFPLSTIPDTDQMGRKCADVYEALKNAWPFSTRNKNVY